MRRAASRLPVRRIPAVRDRLREATKLLGGQQATGRRRSAELYGADGRSIGGSAKTGSGPVRDLMAQQNAARAAGQPQKYPTAQEIDKLVTIANGRAMSSGVSLRICAPRAGTAPTQPRLPANLRGALEGMDENDLGTRMQREFGSVA